VSDLLIRLGGLLSQLREFQRLWLPLAILAPILAIMAIVAPEFFQLTNILIVARQSSIVGVLAVGMTLVILTAGIDLSVGSILAVSGVVMALLLNDGMPLAVALPACIAVGAGIGALNGIGIARLGIQPFIMTLASMVTLQGIALQLANGQPQAFSASGSIFDFFGNGGIGQIPGPILIFLIMALGGWALLRYLPFGRFLYAIGGSKEAARLSGVRISRTLIGAYLLSGLCAGIAGAMTASQLSTGDPTVGGTTELDAIAAVVIGGTSLFGGVGGMGGTVVGALLLAVLANVLDLAGVSPFNQLVAKGLVIVIAVLLAARTTGRRLSDHRKATPATPAARSQTTVIVAEPQSSQEASNTTGSLQHK